LTVTSTNVTGEVIELSHLAPHNQIDFVHRDDPHITLYLTDFVESSLNDVLVAVKKVLAEQGQICQVELSGMDAGATGYVMWNVELSDCLQRLSNSVVLATYQYATPNQSIPPWVNSLPKAEREKKIAMIEKYGSPNVFSEFQPHLTIAYDTKDAISSIYGSLKNTASFEATQVVVSKTGPFGTVLKSGSVENITLGKDKSQALYKAEDYCKPSSNFDWDYLLLVREWPGTMTPGPLPSYVKSFTLHGLWPNRNDGSYPQCCNNSYPFSYNQIEPIIDDVRRVWYDTLHDNLNGTSFWEHEWSKHGTCAVSDGAIGYTELDYFQACVDLHDKMLEYQWLAAAGIYPSSTKEYYQDDFVAAIQKSLGQTPLIKCQYKDHQNVIANIGVCIDKNLNVMECPSNQVSQWSHEANCEDKFLFPEIPH